jgi:hypothetical protein
VSPIRATLPTSFADFCLALPDRSRSFRNYLMTLPSVNIHHSTSHPYRFFGRTAELALLHQALLDGAVSVITFVGPGGQGKTAIVQQWLAQIEAGEHPIEGVFLWSFYRGKDADLCLRELYATVSGTSALSEVSATYCVDHLLPLLRGKRWIVVLDGTEVVQYETDPWFGRFLHPELSRLLEESASESQASVIVLTTRFVPPELERRPLARAWTLGSLDPVSARSLLTALGVHGTEAELNEAAASCGGHAKAVELLGTYLVYAQLGKANHHRSLKNPAPLPGASQEEQHVLRVMAAFQAALPQETQDILALTTAFRDPPTEARLLEYLASQPVQTLLHETWKRNYPPLALRPPGWLWAQLQSLVEMRLLERVSLALGDQEGAATVLDAHPLVRRSFEHVLSAEGRRQSAGARAGFLHRRPDRRRAANLEEARADVELLHAYCDAGLWEEAERVLTALDRPRYRFLAPAFERDLLLRFFPGGDWRQRPLWTGFSRYRALAVCLELLGCYEDALSAYAAADAPLRGDALIALGRLGPLLEKGLPPHPWAMLWQAYQAHALCLAGRTEEAVALCGKLVPVDVYEWTHVFECLLRTGHLNALDMKSFLYRPPHAAESLWDQLGRQRMRADYLRLTDPDSVNHLGPIYATLLEEYDRGGLPYERTLTRLSYARRLLTQEQLSVARNLNAITLDLAQRYQMRILEADAWDLEAEIGRREGDSCLVEKATRAVGELRQQVEYRGPARP